jgi:hypothetical protein
MKLKPFIFIIGLFFLLHNTYGLCISNNAGLTLKEELFVDVNIKVTTDKEIYLYGETVNITISNIDSRAAAGYPNLNIYLITPNYFFNIRDVFSEELTTEIKPGESFTYSWNQKDNSATQVVKGEYLIEFYFLHCKGIQAKNITTIRIHDNPIYIESIKGGIGITTIIKNIGTEDIIKLDYSIELLGLIFYGSVTEQVIDTLRAGEIIKLNILPLGIGSADLLLTVGNVEKKLTCFLFGPLLLLGNGKQ